MYLSQSQVKDQNILQLMDEIVAGGGEGCVLRADRPYDHCRGSKTTKDSMLIIQAKVKLLIRLSRVCLCLLEIRVAMLIVTAVALFA